MRVVLWDVDGTLLKNSSRAGRLYHEAIRRATGFEPTDDRPGEHGKTDGQILTERLAFYELGIEHFDAVSAELDVLSAEAYTGEFAREIVPGVPEALTAVRDAGWRNGLLTGNSRTRARVKLIGAGLSESLFDWDQGFFGDRSPTRPDLTRSARAALGGTPAVIIGDTPSDVSAAAVVGWPCIAVATGVFSTDDLTATDAALVVPDLVTGLPDVLDALRAIG